MVKSLIIIKNYCRYALYIIFHCRYPFNWKERKSNVKSIDAAQKKIVYVCDGRLIQGGFADRMKGVLTTYYEAKRRKVRFFISWDYPFDLREFVIPADYDWRVDREDILYDYDKSFPVIININSPYHIINIIKKYSFKHLLNGRRDKLVYANMNYAEPVFRELYYELFKPTEYLQEKIDFHLSNIGTDYWSYTFRFGNMFNDFKDLVGYPLGGGELIDLLDKNINELRKMLEDLPNGYKALITSDSLYFLNRIEDVDDRIYIVKEQPMHPDFPDNSAANKETWCKTFLDFYLIANAKMSFLLTRGQMYKSGFPGFASLIGNHKCECHNF